MARISRHHHGLRRALRSAPDLDHFVDPDEMFFHPLAPVETGGVGRFDDRLEMAVVHIAEHAGKIAAGLEFIARRVGAVAGFAEWLDQSRTPACDLSHDDTP
jgi:hypothetical protein